MSNTPKVVPTIVRRYAESLSRVNTLLPDDIGHDLNTLRAHALDAIKQYKREKVRVAQREAERREITEWLKSIDNETRE